MVWSRDSGGRTLAWAERHIRRKGKEWARLDVTAANGTLQEWYTDRGYEIVGTREFDHPGWNEVVLLEKSLPGGDEQLITRVWASLELPDGIGGSGPLSDAAATKPCMRMTMRMIRAIGATFCDRDSTIRTLL